MTDKRAVSLPGGVKEQITDSDNLITGNIHTIDGTESAPSHSFQDDTNSGMSSGGTSVLRFSTNSNWRYQVESNGTLSVNSALNYETLVTDDDDIPNKKYVDDNAGGSEALPGIEQTLFVDKTSSSYTADGTISKPYNTVGAAITAATALTPSATNKIAIVIYPGIYDEAVKTADSYVNLIGIDRDTCIIKPSTSGAAPLDIDDSNVHIANLTISRATSTGNFTLYVDTVTGIEFNNIRVIMDGGSNDEVTLKGVSSANFRDCIIEDVVSEANLILDDTTGGTYRFFNCIFKGRSLLLATHYFYNCHFQANSTAPVITASGASPNLFRMYGCTVRRSGAANGNGIQISNATLDWGLLNCDIDAAQGSSNVDVVSSFENPGVLSGCIIGTKISDSVKLKSEARRWVKSAGGTDVYDALEDALDSLPVEGGVVELTEDVDIGVLSIDPRVGTTGKVILEGNGFEITGNAALGWLDSRTNCVFEIRNVKLDVVKVRLNADGMLVLRNVQMYNGSYISIPSSANSNSKIIIDNVDIDGTLLTSGTRPIQSSTANAAQILINDSSFTGRSIAGNNGAAVYFAVAGAVLRAINSLFIHPIGGVNDHEIDANAAVTVYTQYCMTRANAIGSASNVTEGITTNYNVVDSNAGFLWRE